VGGSSLLNDDGLVLQVLLLVALSILYQLFFLSLQLDFIFQTRDAIHFFDGGMGSERLLELHILEISALNL